IPVKVPVPGRHPSEHHKQGKGRHQHGRRHQPPIVPIPVKVPVPGRHGLAGGGMLAGLPVCAAVAAAQSLLLATGIRASEDDILALHGLGGGCLEPTFAALLRRGLAGVRAAGVRPVDEIADGVVASLAFEGAQDDQGTWDADPSPFWGLHAAVLAGGHALTWGREIPVTQSFLARQMLGAWEITWEGGVWPTPPAWSRGT